MFLVWLVQFLKKKSVMNLNFHDQFYCSSNFLNLNSAQYEWARNNKESMICLTPKPSWNFFIYRIQSKEKSFTEKEIFKEKGNWRM